jgi:hypothetical protein
MNVDLIQLLYYAGFAVLGWWLRSQGLIRTPAKTPAPTPPSDREALLELLKSLLDRLAQAPAAGNPNASVFHVPIEVAASPRPESK